MKTHQPCTYTDFQISELLSLADARTAYLPSHPRYVKADAAANTLFDAALGSDRLIEALVTLMAHGASLQGLELTPGSVEATLQALAYDAAALVIEEQQDDCEGGDPDDFQEPDEPDDDACARAACDAENDFMAARGL